MAKHEPAQPTGHFSGTRWRIHTTPSKGEPSWSHLQMSGDPPRFLALKTASELDLYATRRSVQYSTVQYSTYVKSDCSARRMPPQASSPTTVAGASVNGMGKGSSWDLKQPASRYTTNRTTPVSRD